ncbi:MAG: hypothetical protein ACRD0W_15250, partial [Acidimicrobiales bacterium]
MDGNEGTSAPHRAGAGDAHEQSEETAHTDAPGDSSASPDSSPSPDTPEGDPAPDVPIFDLPDHEDEPSDETATGNGIDAPAE